MKNANELINNIYNEDCLSFMKKINEGTIALIATDSPVWLFFMNTKAAN